MAAADLSYAFEHCPRDAAANRARCVYYLVPVKMLLGELPTEEVLTRFGLTQYAPIVQVTCSVPHCFCLCQPWHIAASGRCPPPA